MSSPLLTTSTLHRHVRYDARREILDSLGDLSAIRVLGNQMIVAPYVHSGVLWSPKLGFPLEERLSIARLYELYDSGEGLVSQRDAVDGIHQGKVYLVIRPGEEADKYGLKPGDWVMTLQECTREVSVTSSTAKKSRVLKFLDVDYAAGWPCKVVYETDLYMILDHQDAVV